MEEFQHNGLSILSQSAHESDALAFGRSISSGSNGGAGGGNSVTIYEHMPSRPTLGADAAGIVSEHPASVAAAVDAVTDFANPHKKVKITAHDTEAASSLLGFFNQLERNSSQEDMLHFFEGVQNHVIASTTSNTSTSTVRSPPKPSGNNSSSSTNPSSGGGGGGGTSTNGKNGTATYSPTNMATPAFAGGSAH